MIEYRLRRNPPLQQFFLALEIGLRIIQLRLCLLHAGAGLLDLRLQRSRVDFRQHVPQLYFLTDGESNGFYSPVSNIGDIWSLEEGSDEGSIVLDIDEVGLDAILQQFV